MKDLRYMREPFLEYGQRFEAERNKIIYRHGFLIECLIEQQMAYYLLKLYSKKWKRFHKSNFLCLIFRKVED